VLVNWQEPIDGFELNENAMVDDNVEPIARNRHEGLVLYRAAGAVVRRAVHERKLGAETRLVADSRSPGPKQRCTSISAPMIGSVPYSKLPISRSPCSTSPTSANTSLDVSVKSCCRSIPLCRGTRRRGAQRRPASASALPHGIRWSIRAPFGAPVSWAGRHHGPGSSTAPSKSRDDLRATRGNQAPAMR